MKGSDRAPTPDPIGAATVGAYRVEFLPASAKSASAVRPGFLRALRCLGALKVLTLLLFTRRLRVSAVNSLFSAFSSASSAPPRQNTRFPWFRLVGVRVKKFAPGSLRALCHLCALKVLTLLLFTRRLRVSAVNSLFSAFSSACSAPPRQNTRFPWFRLVRVREPYAARAARECAP